MILSRKERDLHLEFLERKKKDLERSRTGKTFPYTYRAILAHHRGFYQAYKIMIMLFFTSNKKTHLEIFQPIDSHLKKVYLHAILIAVCVYI